MAKKTAPATDAAPATTPVVASTPTPRARKAPAKTEVTVPVVAAAPVAETAPAVVAAPVEARSADAILTSVQEALKSLNTEVTARVRALVADALAATKAIKRDARSSKQRRKVDPETLSPEARATWEARRANNAFLKMRPISPELCSFMGVPTGSQRSQTDVTKFVATYVKAHNCFDPNMKRRILPNTTLAKLLRVTDKQEVTYLNLQSFLKVHFLKTDAPKTA